MSNSENSNTKRISIDLPEELISRFDQLRKEWGFRARGPVIEKLLTEILQEEELLPKSQQQTIDYSEKGDINEYSNFDENSALVLIKSDKDESTSKESEEKLILNNKEVIEKPRFPYNILITNDWIAIIKRKYDHVHGFSVNGLGFAGYLLVTEKSNIKYLKKYGPEKLLENFV